MFAGAKVFNQPLFKWNICRAENMNRMFYMATDFNQSLTEWTFNDYVDRREMFDGTTGYLAMQSTDSQEVANDSKL